MRRSYLVCGLVVGATANDLSQWKRSVEQDSALGSRELSGIFQSLEARHAFDDLVRGDTVAFENPLAKRDDDTADDFRDHQKDLHDEDDKDENQEKDHDLDDGPPEKYMGGGTIAGVVLGVIIALLLALALWYFLRIRPRRKQRHMMVAKEDDIEDGYKMTPVSSTHRSTPPVGAVNDSRSPSEHIRWAPTPYPERAPSIQTGSSMSGLALPTPALTYSPSVTTAATPNSPPSPRHAPSHIPSEKPPAYATLAALHSSEPQPEASAYQMGQVPMPSEPPMYQLPLTPHAGMTPDMSGEHLARY
ncbi:hypothetical protein F4804DRAFT_207535 [Jackrogersella minutella]|nr:hypothetical protein F4804DRAFT_207535 [Jackrogersella minutella]